MLVQNGFTISSQSFLDEKNYAVNYKPGLLFLKAWVVIKGFGKRIGLLLKVKILITYSFIGKQPPLPLYTGIAGRLNCSSKN